jgi:hypothetical protein
MSNGNYISCGIASIIDQKIRGERMKALQLELMVRSNAE